MASTQSKREAAPASERRLTIDELAQATGLTVRNVRSYQSRGLIPPPEVQGRVGYYGAEHLARLQLIREMQAQGFNLAAIAHVLERARGSGEEVLGFTRSLMAPFETEAPEIVERADLAGRLGGALAPKLLTKAQKLGLVIPIDENCFEVPSPTLLAAGERLVSLGVPLEAALDTMDQLKRNTHRIAQTFVQMFLEFIWKPFDDAGRPESDWPAVRPTAPACLRDARCRFRTDDDPRSRGRIRQGARPQSHTQAINAQTPKRRVPAPTRAGHVPDSTGRP
jgi:DNA-binding transcriptional MerR regulator